MDQLEILIPITLFLSITTVLVLRGPLGKGLADRLSGRAGVGPDDREVRELRGDVDALRQELTEVHERLDFAERMLARQEPAALPPPQKGAPRGT